MKTRAISFLLTMVTGILIGLFAFSATSLWIGWFVTFGFVSCSCISDAKRSVSVIGLSAIAVLLGCLLVRFVPIYELPWSGADRVTISNLTNDWRIELTDPNDIEEFAKYGECGYYSSMLKSGFGVHVYVTHGGTSRGYYVHGDAIGRRPGGFIQSIFIPKQPGFMEYLEDQITKSGHKR